MTKGEETRKMIIEQAAPVFNRKGIAATAMSDIMEATGLAKGSLYVHFQNKEVLAAAVVNYNMNLLLTKIKNAIGRQTHPKNKLYAYLDLYMDPREPAVVGGCPMMNFGVEADDTNEPVRKMVAAMMESIQDLLFDILQQGVREGFFSRHFNPREFATQIFALVEGGLMISRIAGEHRKMRQIILNIKKMVEQQTLEKK
jgi:TetR/AcrR family transcriptional repressor of nem operon